MKILLSYDSLSQNTKELSYIIKDILEKNGNKVNLVYIQNAIKDINVVEELKKEKEKGLYDLYIFGTWTSNRGKTPPKMKDYIMKLLVTSDNKPNNVACFGTGDKQFGLNNYCGGAENIGAFFKTPYPILKIEQRFRDNELDLITKWCEEITNESFK